MNRSYSKPRSLGLCLSASGLFGALPVLWATEPAIESSLGELSKVLNQNAAHVDWDREFRAIERNLDRMWRENGWNDESDRFAHSLVREVSAIPPWQFFDRLNLISQRTAERYALPTVDAARFKGALIREAGGVLVRNSPTVVKQVQEMVRVMQDQQPVNAEQVAHWMQESMPMLAETYESIDRLITELKSRVDPQHREILERDVQSYGKRRVWADKMMSRWAEGGWNPRDWGLEADPRYTGPAEDIPSSVVPVRPPARMPFSDPILKAPVVNVPLRIPKWLPYDPSTWFAFVLEAEKRYRLDPGQFTAARSIHDELFARAAAYSTSHAEELKPVRPEEKAEHTAYEPIRHWFEELRQRVEAIPTTAQRAQQSP